jgi:hypothetical protein
MTADNGKEFARFAALERKLGLAVYFAQPVRAYLCRFCEPSMAHRPDRTGPPEDQGNRI